MWRIGLDIGGTKIEALAVSPGGEELDRRRIASPRGDYTATIDAIARLVDSLRNEHAIAGDLAIGAGIPGSLSPRTGLVRNANSTWLNGRPFGADLQARLGGPLFMENDANCFVLSEAADGAGCSFETVFGIILGTGVGGGIVHRGDLLIGRNAIAGEWGHNPLPWPSDDERATPPCFCGRRGCIEQFLSGPALERDYARRGGDIRPAHEIAERAAGGEAAAAATLETYCDRLARALAHIVNILDPDVIVFGGGLSNVDSIREGARARLPAWVFSDVCETELRRNRWGDSSGVRGAAMLPLLRGNRAHHDAPC